MPEYIKGAELPDLAIGWTDSDGAVIDFSTGWSFDVKVGQPGSTARFTKTTGITGAATSPNITIAWAATGELNGLPAGTWTVQVTATHTADSKERKMATTIVVKPSVS